MRKLPLILSVFLLLTLVPHAWAWRGITHRRVAEVAFDAFPENVRQNLVLSEIYRGSILPDIERYPGHFQPEARSQAIYWLKIAKDRYARGEFRGASLALGIACHYIADACCLAHNPPYEHAYNWELHTEFENSVVGVWPSPPGLIPDFDLSRALERVERDAHAKWPRWIQNRGTPIALEIARGDLDNAAIYTYNAWYQTLVGVTPPVPEASPFDARVVVGVAFAALVVAIAVGMKRYYRM